MHGAVGPADRDILTGYESVRSEKKAGFIVVLIRDVIVKNPMPVLRTTRLVHEQSHLVVLTF
jgi:hypothetical protein